jgi:hypothetical protein
MKDKLISFLGTAFKGLGGVGGFLAGKGLIDAGDLGMIDAAGQSLALTLATIVGAILAHLIGKLLAKYAPGFLGSVGSGKSPLFIITAAVGVSMAGVLLSSCGLSMTSDGCALGTYVRNGKTYKAGPCVGSDGKINRLRVAWNNDQGDELQATVYQGLTPTLIEYRNKAGFWITWTSKSGVMLGQIPTEVETALKKDVATSVSAALLESVEIASGK